MNARPTFLLDADVLISAKNSYYSFGICPGFWNSLVHPHETADIRILDRVQRELAAGNDDLEEWTRAEVPARFFLTTNEPDVLVAYARVMQWVNDQEQYQERARTKFARGADGWLAAYAHARGSFVVTHEQSHPQAKARVPLPDVCTAFGVEHGDTFHMLDKLGIRFDWSFRESNDET